MNRHNWTEKAARVPKRARSNMVAGRVAAWLLHNETEADKLLVAEAIQRTRVSYLTNEQRKRLGLLVTRITGYKIEGGL